MMVLSAAARAVRSVSASVLLAAGFLAVASAPAPAFAVEALAPQDVVTSLDHSLLDIMQNAQKLGYKGRYAAIAPVVHQVFNLPYMTRLAVGSGWATLSADQQAALTDAFANFITATYARRFDGYSGEKFVTGETKPMGDGVLVQTQLIKSDGEPIALNYVARQQDGNWQVVDVFLTGTISEMATRRSEFSSVFREAGYAGLLSRLQQKVSQMASDGHLS